MNVTEAVTQTAAEGDEIVPSRNDIVVFLDETGYPSLNKIDPQFPIFLVALLICTPNVYIGQIVPTVYRFKYHFFGHEGIILHSHEIRKRYGPFAILNDPAIRAPFLQSISDFMAASDYGLILSGIHKQAHKERYGDYAANPYELALTFALERLARGLQRRGYSPDTHVTILAEARGKREDAELELSFLRTITEGTSFVGRDQFAAYSMRLVFVTKAMNVVGLQLADLVTYPAARHMLRRTEPNPAYDAFREKIWNEKEFPTR